MSKGVAVKMRRLFAIILAAVTIVSTVPVNAYASEIVESIDTLSNETDSELVISEGSVSDEDGMAETGNSEIVSTDEGIEEVSVTEENEGIEETSEADIDSDSGIEEAIIDDAIESSSSETVEEVVEEETIDDEDIINDIKCGYIDNPEGLFQCGAYNVPTFSEEYYDANASQLNSARTKLYNGLLRKTGTISLSGCNIYRNEVEALYYGVVNDHPELYYVVTGFGYSYDNSGLIISISPKYLNGFNDNLFQDAVDRAMSSIDSSMTDLEKAIVLHDFIVTTTRYNKAVASGGSGSGNIRNTYGVLVEHDAVCQGYAMTYKMLLDKAGITAYYVSSDDMNHAWNIVELDGQYYYVDATWDDPMTYKCDVVGRCNHNYMFVSEDAFRTSSSVRDNHYGTFKIYVNSVQKKLPATSTIYDNMYWTYIDNKFVGWGEGVYSFFYVYNGYGYILMTDNIAGSDDDWWCFTDINNGYYSSSFRYKNYLYYNQSDGIYRIDCNEIDYDSEDYKDDGSFTGEKVYNYNSTRGIAFRYNGKTGNAEVLLGDNSYNTYTVSIDDLDIETEELTYSITYITNGGVLPSDAIVSYSKGDEFDLPLLPDIDGYYFFGWYSNASLTGTPVSKITKDTSHSKTFYAKWAPKTPGKITFGSTGDFVLIDDESSCTSVGTPVSLDVEGDKADIKIYYTVNGATPTNKSKLYTEPFVIQKETVVKAIAYRGTVKGPVTTNKIQIATCNFILGYDKTVVHRKDNFKIQIEELPSSSTEEYIYWESSDENIIKVEDDGTLTALNLGTVTITGTVPDWLDRPVEAECEVEVIPALQTVTFNGFGGIQVSQIVINEYTDATAPAIPETVLGYFFSKWDRVFTNVSEDITVNAIYELQDYTLEFDTNGGELLSSLPTKYTYESEDIILPAPGRDGYEFVGWYDNSAFTGTPVSKVENGSTGDKKFYAKWVVEKKLWMQWRDCEDEYDTLSVEYTGRAIKPEFDVYYGTTLLTLGKDYTAAYKNNINVNVSGDDSKAPVLVITGKGNYVGRISKKFDILPKDISEDAKDIDVAAVTLNYTSREQKKNPVVTWNGKALTAKDLDFYYTDETEGAYKEVGSYKIKISGKGNYTGSREAKFIQIINTKDESAPVLFNKCSAKIVSFAYSGEEIDFANVEEDLSHVTVKNGKETLIYNKDYTLLYGTDYNGIPCKEIGTYTVVVKGMGKYYGELRTKFSITGINIATAKVSAIDTQIFDNTAKEPALSVSDKNGDPIVLNKDYEVVYENNVNAGSAKVTIYGIGKYYGKCTKTFKISQFAVNAATEDAIEVTFNDGAEAIAYEKGGAKPAITVTYNNGSESLILKETLDYTVAYKNNTSVVPVAGRTPELTVILKKNFTGKKIVSFNINKQDISKLSISVPDMMENAIAGRYLSVPSVTDINGKKLAKNVDYETVVVYKDLAGNVLDKKSKPVAGDIINVYVTGKNNYYGTIKGSFRIFAKGMTVASARVTVKPDSASKLIYSGEPVTLTQDDLVVTVGKETLTKNDYTIVESSYTNNVNKGIAKVTIVGKGQYAGTKTVSFSVKPQTMVWWKRVLGL